MMCRLIRNLVRGVSVALGIFASGATSASEPSSAPDPAHALNSRPLLDALRKGGYTLYFRHTSTDFSKLDGAMRDGTSNPSLLISWGLTDGLVYSYRNVNVADAACVGVFSAGGNTLVVRSNHGFGHPATGVWAILLSPPGEIKAPEDPLMIQLSEKPIYREYVNAAGDRITIIEAHSQQDPTRLNLKEFKVDFNSGVHSLIREVPNFETASVERIGYNEKTGEFMVLRSEEARKSYLHERQKNSAPLMDSEQISE